ncbi:MAG: helix-hairpin-helix domain-containing protein [Verrucomicrobia bacterium]|nr:helix-hairpin-helix domain-containing protein [Verrucomicrobiota bacterium]
MSPQENDKKRQEEMVDNWMNTLRGSKNIRTQTVDRTADSPDWWKPEEVDPEIEAAISDFQMSEAILAELGCGDGDSDDVASENAVKLPLIVILDILPSQYVQADRITDQVRDKTVTVLIDDLYSQLARGQIRISIARLCFGVPVGLVSSAALRDKDTLIKLPLKTVVNAMSGVAFSGRLSPAAPRFDIDNLPSLFQAPPQAPVNREEPRVPAAPPVEPVREAPPPLAPEPAVERQSITPIVAPVAVPPDGEPVPSAAPAPVSNRASIVRCPPTLDRLNGVDLNVATVQELLTLDGVTLLVAQQIVSQRREQGRFASVFDVASVPRVGRKTFQRITGMPYSRTGRHRLWKLMKLLGLETQPSVTLPELVAAVAARSGLTGCLISDRDGLLMAESGIGDMAHTLSALGPKLMGGIRESFEVMDWHAVQSASIVVAGRMLTIMSSGDIFITVVQQSNRLTAGLLSFVRRVTEEVAWLFSYRGYVVPETSEAETTRHAG